AARLEAELTRAELDQMRVQLQPQLIEDTLQATAAFVRAGASTQAVQLLARLSDVLRLTLATLGEERVSLRQELEFLQAYLGLQQIRAPGRLRSRVDIAAEALTAEVPSLALFQLAELPASPWEGALELSAAVVDGRLGVRLHQLATAQPGVEVTEAADRLARLRQRLDRLYPRDYALHVEHQNAGLLCTLEIPLVHLESRELFPAGGLLATAR
ncbi:MAG: histidine kinase, partial [Myxococcaceae bacterium]